MALKVSQDQLPQLLSWLEQYLPASFKLHDDLKTHLAGMLPYLVFFVDRWPDPQAVSAVVDPAGHQLEGKEFYENRNMGVFGMNSEALASLLEEKQVVDWSKSTAFEGIPDVLWPLVTAVIEDKAQLLRSDHYLLLSATSKDMKAVAVPEGMHISAGTQDMVHVVNSTWPYAETGSEGLIRGLIRHHPSVRLATKDGQHVGHALGQIYGTMGMVHVLPEFRGKGYAKVICSALLQKYCEKTGKVSCIVNENNHIALKLYQSLGFKVVPNVQMAWMKCAPKPC